MNGYRLIDIFPDFETLRSIEPEELAGVLLEMLPHVQQGGRFLLESFVEPSFNRHQPKSYPDAHHGEAKYLVAEALSWLVTQGLAIVDPQQSGSHYRLTRRGERVKTRHDLEAFRKGRILPVELLPSTLAQKVQHLFLRGDHDTAVFQAFKEVEVNVREIANLNGAGYPDDLVGVKLMRNAFHPDTGPLTDKLLPIAEREAEMHLFSGAIGHAKNPTGHRDVRLDSLDAVRLIVFAAHLLELLAKRL